MHEQFENQLQKTLFSKYKAKFCSKMKFIFRNKRFVGYNRSKLVHEAMENDLKINFYKDYYEIYLTKLKQVFGTNKSWIKNGYTLTTGTKVVWIDKQNTTSKRVPMKIKLYPNGLSIFARVAKFDQNGEVYNV